VYYGPMKDSSSLYSTDSWRVFSNQLDGLLPASCVLPSILFISCTIFIYSCLLDDSAMDRPSTYDILPSVG